MNGLEVLVALIPIPVAAGALVKAGKVQQQVEDQAKQLERIENKIDRINDHLLREALTNR